jgi:predicted outer membrane lipoprotein
MFGDKFWLNLLLTIPVVVLSDDVSMWLGYQLPVFPGSVCAGDPRHRHLPIRRHGCFRSTRTSASTAAPASRNAWSTPIFPEESVPPAWAAYTEINALWYEDREAARRIVHEHKSA